MIYIKREIPHLHGGFKYLKYYVKRENNPSVMYLIYRKNKLILINGLMLRRQ